MGRRALLVAQGAAVGLVILLFALLVWKLVSDGRGALAAEVARGDEPAAPGFSAARLDREGHLSLSSLRGRAVLINFFASWCNPCREEAPTLEQTWRRYRHAGLVVLGVDWKDFSSDGRAFMRRHGTTYPGVFDGSGSIGRSYGITGVPESFVVDRRGRVIDAIVGAVNTDADRARLDRGIRQALAS